ncbi:hypothetical protein [Streptomyces pseudogriseolus]|uniref:hypothetical protein n=1 Tax=Streptomyces pseudogriseolus TaxID=36817 RepID=UPI003FA2B65C
MPGTQRGVDRDQVEHGERLESGCQLAHRAQAGDGRHAERRPSARGQSRPAARQQYGAEQPAPLGRRAVTRSAARTDPPRG